jgi:hypothetical protein
MLTVEVLNRLGLSKRIFTFRAWFFEMSVWRNDIVLQGQDSFYHTGQT